MRERYRELGAAGTAASVGLEVVALASRTPGPPFSPSPLKPPPQQPAEPRGGVGAAAAPRALQERGARSAAVAISHQMSPSAAKAEPGADNGCASPGVGGAGPGGPQSRASADTYSPAPTLCLSLSSPSIPGCCCHPLGYLPYEHHFLHIPSCYLLNTSFFRRQGRPHLFHGACPSLVLIAPTPQLDACLGAIAVLPDWAL